jgi:hypothetical protein
MWDVLSGDFDISITPDRCIRNVMNNAKRGSIIIFHDSEKAFPHLQKCMPAILRSFVEKGFRFEAISL